jgi:hypothetical protein
MLYPNRIKIVMNSKKNLLATMIFFYKISLINRKELELEPE